MPKTFPIKLEVEEIALGTVLRRLDEMHGVVKIDLGLSGPRKALPHPVAKNGNGATFEMQIVALLANGPQHISALCQATGRSKAKIYGTMHGLKKKKIVKSNGGGVYELTPKAMADLRGGGMQQAQPIASNAPALTAPVRHGPKGRAAPGSGNIVLRRVLAEGALPLGEIKTRAVAHGVSSKSMGGIVDRAKKSGFIKHNGTGYELTAKGMKIEVEAAHG
jgi:predicted transcriptional regulator